MAKRSTPSDKIKIDPLFVIPEGAEDQFVYSTEGTDGIFFEDVFDSFDEDGTEEEDGESGGLGVPESFSIVSQKLRRAPGGQQVVDVVIETDDIEGAVKYEMEVTKA